MGQDGEVTFVDSADDEVAVTARLGNIDRPLRLTRRCRTLNCTHVVGVWRLYTADRDNVSNISFIYPIPL